MCHRAIIGRGGRGGEKKGAGTVAGRPVSVSQGRGGITRKDIAAEGRKEGEKRKKRLNWLLLALCAEKRQQFIRERGGGKKGKKKKRGGERFSVDYQPGARDCAGSERDWPGRHPRWT